MYSFKKYVEAISHEESSKTQNFTTLIFVLEKLPHKQQVEFALMCAKEAYHISPEDQIKIDLVEKWLKDSVSKTQINSLYTGIRSRSGADAALNSIVSDTAEMSALAADHTAYENSTPIYTYQQHIRRYIQIASSFLSKTTLKDEKIAGFLNDEHSLAILFDYLEEQGENLIIKDKDKFILNVPGHNIVGNNNIDLAKKCLEPRNRWVLDYLKRLYV